MSELLEADSELLARFLATGESEPFALLVQRHDRMVLGVARRILGKVQDAEDVAQAVFLALAHKARSLTGLSSLAAWLHCVAIRCSCNVLESEARRKNRERKATLMDDHTQAPPVDWEELRPLLDREIDRLPSKYRVPLVLHYLEERTQEEIARELGEKEGTISTWLHRGRELLRDRLARAGVTISGAALGSLLLENACSAEALSSASVAATAAAVASGKTVEGGTLKASVQALAKGGLKSMMFTKLKIAAAFLVAGMGATAGAGVVAHQVLGMKGQTAPTTADKVVRPIPTDLTPESLPKVLAAIRPKDSEWRHLRVNWISDTTAARKKAAAEDKPIIIINPKGAGYNDATGSC